MQKELCRYLLPVLRKKYNTVRHSKKYPPKFLSGPFIFVEIFECFFEIVKRIIQQTFKILKTNEWLKEISDNNIFQSVITLLSQVVTQRNGYRF